MDDIYEPHNEYPRSDELRDSLDDANEQISSLEDRISELEGEVESLKDDRRCSSKGANFRCEEIATLCADCAEEQNA